MKSIEPFAKEITVYYVRETTRVPTWCKSVHGAAKQMDVIKQNLFIYIRSMPTDHTSCQILTSDYAVFK